MVEARVGLAMALQGLGREKDARAVSDSLQSSHPNSAEALILQSRLCMDRSDRAGAEKALVTAIAAHPSNGDAHYLLGNVLMLGGRWKDALDHSQHAVSNDPNHVRARWSLVMAQIAPVPASVADAQKARSNFARMLNELDKWFDASRLAQGHAAVGSTQPFYLAYQASSNRELLQKYGALCARWCGPDLRYPGAADVLTLGRRADRRLRQRAGTTV